MSSRHSLPLSSDFDDLDCLLEDQESSGLSIAAYAREHGIAAWRLYRARRERHGSPHLVEFSVVDTPQPGQALEVVVADKFTVRIPAGFDASTLRRLIGELQAC